MNKNIKVVAFDADDTLWINEPFFEEAEKKFCGLMEDFLSHQGLSQQLFTTQVANLPLYGYGIKGYILSMIETAYQVSNGKVSNKAIEKIIEIGKDLLQKPVELLPGVHETLQALQGKYKLVVATKGDLKDQQRKLHLSGLGAYFHHIEVMTEKADEDYQKLLQRLDIQGDEFFMIGNSLKSDILPVLNVGGSAVHVPFTTTWAHERIDHEIVHPKFKTVSQITEILDIL
ncbi:HAD family hydrolase [Flavobacterium agricola]|uniref:HAD family hydrolase n=1 Tax=Flavobacterium agricola TaxID=2870839 RepID=A0ABY6M115_9FLAO|nr:HAD family hydrolase [Flavobacterium agricola]UYW01105.1 HAD family hydrolase [Flavobacterium agricola]